MAPSNMNVTLPDEPQLVFGTAEAPQKPGGSYRNAILSNELASLIK